MSTGFRSFRAAVTASLVGQGLNLTISAAFLLLSSRWLGPANRGTHALLQSSAQFGAMLLGLGFSGAVPVIVGRHPGALSKVLRLQWKLGGAEFAVSLLALALGARTFFPVLDGRVLLLALTIVALSVQTMAFGAMLAIGDARTPNVVTVVGTALSLCTLIAGRAAGGMSVNLVLIAQLLGAATSAALNVENLRRRSLASSAEAPPEALLQAAVLPSLQGYLSNVLALVLFRGDLFIVERFGGGLHNAGLYAVAVFAAELVLKVPQWASGVLTASVAMESARGKRQSVGLFVGSIIAAGLCVLPLLFLRVPLDRTLTIVLGKDYRGIATLMLVLGPRLIMQAGTVVLAANLAGRGFTWYHPLASGAGMVAVLSLDLALVPRFGALGAATASSIGYSAAASVMLLGFLRYERISLVEFARETGRFTRELVGATRHRMWPATVRHDSAPRL